MYQLSTLLAVFAFTAVNAVPLNINLGAYSPALVVGDGEISFGAATDVSNLMSSLQGAAVPNGAAAAVAAAGSPAPAAAAGTAGTAGTAGKQQVPAVAEVAETPATDSSPVVAASAPVVIPASADKQAPVAQQQQVDTPATPASPASPAVASPSPTLQSGLGLGPDKKFILPREPVAEAEPDMAEAIKNLQREVASLKAGKKVESVLTPRDLAGFQAALNFATAAMKVSPPIDLGTGAEGSGVGIKVGSGASGAVAGAGTKTAGAKRGITAIKVISKRDTPELESAEKSSKAERSVDAVNLNLGDQSGPVSLTITEI